MTIYEIIAIGLSVLSIIVAVGSIIFAYRTSEKANRIAADQKMISQGQIELQIHQMISQTKKDLLEIALKIQDGQSEVIKQAFETARELNLNAYDEACSKYLDKKVDCERFKRNYHVEIRQLVEDANNRGKFDAVTSKYKCILAVYNEWNNLEQK
jgi:gas vesicle protein